MVALTATGQIKGWNWALMACRRYFNQLTTENSCELWYRSHTGLVFASKAFSVHSDKKTKSYQFCTRKSTRWRDVWSAVLTARWRAVSPSSWNERVERNAVIRLLAASLSRNLQQLSRAFPFSNSLRHGQLMHTHLIKDCQKIMIPHLSSFLLSSFCCFEEGSQLCSAGWASNLFLSPCYFIPSAEMREACHHDTLIFYFLILGFLWGLTCPGSSSGSISSTPSA